MAITRFHPPRDGDGPRQFMEMTKGITGEYVLYGDHLVRITDLEREIKRLKDKLAAKTRTVPSHEFQGASE